MSEPRKCEQCAVVFASAADFSAHWATCGGSGRVRIPALGAGHGSAHSGQPITRAEFEALQADVRRVATGLKLAVSPEAWRGMYLLIPGLAKLAGGIIPKDAP